MELEVLQNKIKKDPGANFDFFAKKWIELVNYFKIVKLSPRLYNENFVKLLNFVTNTISYYAPPLTDKSGSNCDNNHSTPTTANSSNNELMRESNHKESKDGSEKVDGSWLCLNLTSFLGENKNVNLKTRNAILTSTFLLRSRRLVSLNQVVPEWLSVIDLEDRDQRRRLFKFIVKDLTLNKNNHKSINNIVKLLFESLTDRSPNVRLLSVSLLAELYDRRVARTPVVLNKLASLVVSQNGKISLMATYFLLSHKNRYNLFNDDVDLDKDNLDDSDDEVTGNKKKANNKNKNKNKSNYNDDKVLELFEPLELVEGILKKVNSERLKFSEKLVLLRLCASVLRRHELAVGAFYSFLAKFVHHRQRNVHRVLAVFLASLHAKLSPEVVSEIISKVVDDFVSFDRSNDTIILGLNVIRESCSVLPEALSAETLNYLLEFRSYKSKNVKASVKALVNLYRKVNPKLLSKSLRGKEANILLLNEKRRGDNVTNNIEGDDGGDSDLGSEGLEDNQEEIDVDNDYDSGDGDFEDDPDEVYDEDCDEDNADNCEDDDDDNYEDDDVTPDNENEDLDIENEDSDSQKEDENENGDLEDLERRILFVSAKKMRSHDLRRERERRKGEAKRLKKLAVSNKGRRQSLPNKIKERNKPLLMTLKSKRVKKKLNLSVPQQIKRLKRHVKTLKLTHSKKKQRRHN